MDVPSTSAAAPPPKRRRWGGYRRYGRRRYYGRRRGPASYWRRRYWRRVITGRGSYATELWDRAKPYVKRGLSAGIRGASQAIGAAFGGVPGGTIGAAFGDAANTILGLGAYEVKSNTMWASDESQVPAMHSVNETIRVTHREYIGDVFTSANAGEFKIEIYPLNPGLPRSFPWLSPIASCFQEYEVKGFAAQFKSNSGDSLSSTNTALGSVVMSAVYNVNQRPPNSKSDMLNSMWAAEGKPSNNLMLPIECDPSQNPFAVHYVRNAPLNDATYNLQNYDLCNICVATIGCQGSNVNVGELWFTYDVELRKPTSMAENEGENLISASYAHAPKLMEESKPLKFMTEVDGDTIGLQLNDAEIMMPAGTEGVFQFFWNWMKADGTPFVDGGKPGINEGTLNNLRLSNQMYNDRRAGCSWGVAGEYFKGGILYLEVINPALPSVCTFLSSTGLDGISCQGHLSVTKVNPHNGM